MPHGTVQPPSRKLLAFPALSVLPAGPAPRLAYPATTPRQPEPVTDGAALAHDARNALATLELLAGLLAEPGVLTDGNQQLGEDVAQVSGRLSALVGQMARGVQPAARTASPDEAQAETLNAALEHSRRVLTLTAGPRVTMHLSAESALLPVTLVDAQLERVLVNLVKNAAEAMPAGGAVRITARRALSRTAPAVLIQVADDGPGIPAHALDHIFKPGFSSKRSARPWQVECGLGLAIVRQLVEAAGGTIEVRSTLRKGTTFELRLPCRGSSHRVPGKSPGA